jgi:hypothetical protein
LETYTEDFYTEEAENYGFSIPGCFSFLDTNSQYSTSIEEEGFISQTLRGKRYVFS